MSPPPSPPVPSVIARLVVVHEELRLLMRAASRSLASLVVIAVRARTIGREGDSGGVELFWELTAEGRLRVGLALSVGASLQYLSTAIAGDNACSGDVADPVLRFCHFHHPPLGMQSVFTGTGVASWVGVSVCIKTAHRVGEDHPAFDC